MSGPISSPLPLSGDSVTPVPPAPVHPAIQAALDANHLYLLEVGFYISSFLTALRFLWFLVIAGFFAIAGIGASFAAQKASAHGQEPPVFVFYLLAVVFGTLIILTLIFAALEFYAGICLKRRQHPVLIQVIAAFYCLSIPWGTALGVFTFMVLNRPTIRLLFARPGELP